MTTLTFHSDPALKARLVASAYEHQKEDRYIQGSYFRREWGGWKGCSVGCVTAPLVAAAVGVSVEGLTDDHFADWHTAQERYAGIPLWLGHVQDKIFERLPVVEARKWTLRLLTATPVGVDATPAREAWLRDLVFDPERGAISYVANVLDREGQSEAAAKLRALPPDASWYTVYAVATAVGVYAAALASAAACAADAADLSATYAAPSDAAAAAGTVVSTWPAGTWDEFWMWAASRLIHHLVALDPR